MHLSPRPPSHLWPPCEGEIVHYHKNYSLFAFSLVGALQRALTSDRLSLATGGLPCAQARTGLWLEFGVFTGTSIQIIADHRRKLNIKPAVYGFDSFLGLPEHWRDVWRPKGRDGQEGVRKAATMTQGNFAMAGSRPPQLDRRFNDYIEWVVGWYNETLPMFLNAHPSENVTFVHVDCDLYSSSKLVLDQLSPRMSPGTVLVFDELFNYPEYLSHEMRALWEFLHDRPDISIQVLATATRDIDKAPIVENFKQACALKLVARRSGKHS